MILEMINAFSACTCTRLVKVMMATVVNVSLLFHKLDPFVGLVVEYDRDWREIFQ